MRRPKIEKSKLLCFLAGDVTLVFLLSVWFFRVQDPKLYGDNITSLTLSFSGLCAASVVLNAVAVMNIQKEIRAKYYYNAMSARYLYFLAGVSASATVASGVMANILDSDCATLFSSLLSFFINTALYFKADALIVRGSDQLHPCDFLYHRKEIYEDELVEAAADAEPLLGVV